MNVKYQVRQHIKDFKDQDNVNEELDHMKLLEEKKRREQRERRKKARKASRLVFAGVNIQVDLAILLPSSGLDFLLKSFNYDMQSLTYIAKVIYSFNRYLLSVYYMPDVWHIVELGKQQ